MPASYIEVELTADTELVEQLVGILSQLGFEGFWEDGVLLKCYISDSRWSPAMLDEVQTTVNRIARSSSTPRPGVVVRNIESRNWNEEWKKTIEPIQVTDRIVIKPTWHEYTPSAGQIVLTIDPKMSFGTGYHETTRLVLRLMEKYVKPGMSILDVGTGTGVLAIAGVKLGARSAVGVDIDEWSGTNALENVRLNHVERQVTIHQLELGSLPPSTFDLIVANIQLNVIVPLLPEMKRRLDAKGRLILSGLLIPDREQIMKNLSGLGLAIYEEMMENEWMGVVAR
ncbi:MAG: Ribosomal protein methyltransferase [Bacteroidetes bacterium]|nr:Ribosomal protein methyltransferase [Bacteroidota bacterium]